MFIHLIVIGWLYVAVMRAVAEATNTTGTVLGAITMTSSIGMAFGPIGGGWIFDTFGDYHWLYVASAAIGLAAAAIALGFPRPRRPAEITQLAPA